MRSTHSLDSSTQPFDGSPSRTDWLLVCLLAQSSTASDWSAAAALCASIGPGQGTLFRGNWLRPAVYAWVGSDVLLLSFTGTTSPYQWLGQVLGSAQVAQSPIPGSVSVFWGATGVGIWSGLVPFLDSQLGSRRLILVGHSLGGALAQVVGSLANIYDWNPAGIYTAGAPRVGDSTFASSIGDFTWRLEDTGDPIVSLPPVLWAGPGSAFPAPGPGPFATYVHAGSAQTLDPYGQLSDGSNPPGLSSILQQFVAQAAPTHLAGEYARRLRAQWTGAIYQAPGAQGYQNPAALGANFLATLPTSTAQYQSQLCKLVCPPPQN